MAKRIHSYDVLRGIVMFLVVLGHLFMFSFGSKPLPVFVKIFTAFHVPVFFFVAGMFFSIDKRQTIADKSLFLLKKAIYLIVPTLFFYALYYYSHNMNPLAAISDIFYCLITGLGLSFVTDFISKNQYILQIIGSGVIIAYAVYLFVSNPSRQLKSPEERGHNYFKDFYTGFLFTVSNPLIIFLIIGLMARFNIMKPDYNVFHLGAGYIAIFLGAIFLVVVHYIDGQ